jgi:hypothetical protein
LEAAKALELAAEAMGPNPVNPAFSFKPPCKDPVMPEILRIVGNNPAFGDLPPCKITIDRRLLKVLGSNPAFGQLPPCKPIPWPWVQELQITLLETAVWLRYLATAPLEPPKPAPRRRPKAKTRPKRARRRTRR